MAEKLVRCKSDALIDKMAYSVKVIGFKMVPLVGAIPTLGAHGNSNSGMRHNNLVVIVFRSSFATTIWFIIEADQK